MFDFGNNVNVAWCLCGYCIPMSTHIELVCCLEKAGLLDRADRCLHDAMSYVNDCRRHLSMTMTMLGISVCCLCAICVQTRSFEVSNM